MKNLFLIILSLLLSSTCWAKNYEFIITELKGHSFEYDAIGKSLFKNGSPQSGENTIRGVTRIVIKKDLSAIISHNNGIHETQASGFGDSSLIVREDYPEDGVASHYTIYPDIKNEENPKQVLVTFTQTKNGLVTLSGHYWGWASIRVHQ